ncbi:phosphatase PAP2 family protein [Crassaminicella thermophila]|uniref:Phosphatase PAP2 family protein n=2 Tax=Crassaminicella thermophila TaxID=2599308 RepID=A0A5C0SI73_CRATE|nr:phosphatase PAP2 family protein [Crassaminicella thermophila]
MRLLQVIHDYTQSAILDKIMPVITHLGDKGMIWIILSCVLMMSKKYRKVGILSIVALVLSTVIGEAFLKHIIGRTRPFLEVPDIHLLIKKPLTYAFPSGHTTSSFAVAGVISNKLELYRIPFMLLAILIAFSRLYLFVHYPTDILAGIALGLGCSRITLKLFDRKEY